MVDLVTSQRNLRREGGPSAADELAAAQAKLAALVAEIGALDAATESFSLRLSELAARYEEQLGAAFREHEAAERLLRRLRGLDDEVRTWSERLADPEFVATLKRRRASRRPKTRPRRGGPIPDDDAAHDEPQDSDDEDDSEDAAAADEVSADRRPEAAASALTLKRLYRQLARLLHPDLGRDDAERTRLGALMAQVNAAYSAADQTGLELIAAKVGAGLDPTTLTDAERLAHVHKRLEGLSHTAASLRRALDQLKTRSTARLLAEADARAAAGRDYFAETRAELDEELRAATEDTRARWDRLTVAADALGRSRARLINEAKKPPANARRKKNMGSLARKKVTERRLRVFDPLAESAIIRQGVALLEKQRATPEARRLALELETLATERPWEVTLTLLALCAELAQRPPPTLATSAAWAERYTRLHPGDDVPTFDAMLRHLPAHLELGLRTHGQGVGAGVQLRDPSLVAGVRIALRHRAVAALARNVLAHLGSEEICKHCGDTVLLQHLMRSRGLDDVHGLVCPACGNLMRSYWRYGAVEGLDALAPLALELGVVEEQVIRLADAHLGFQMMPAQRKQLTVAGLLRLFADLYLTPYGVELPSKAVQLVGAGRKPLSASAKVPRRPVRLVLRDAGMNERELLERLRLRIARRFKGSD